MTYNHSFKAKVVTIKTIADGTLELSFAVSSSFEFIAGQYITVQLEDVDSANLREKYRDFSICSSPSELPLISIAFRTGRSPFKQSVSKLRPGDTVRIDGPKGVFVLPAKHPVSMVAGGIGVTPFTSMILTPHNFENHPSSVLHYCNRSGKRTVFLHELKSNTENVIIDEHNGEFDMKTVSKEELQDAKRVWFVAGPPAMVSVVLHDLLQHGIPAERIRTEEFSGYV